MKMTVPIYKFIIYKYLLRNVLNVLRKIESHMWILMKVYGEDTYITNEDKYGRKGINCQGNGEFVILID